MEAKIYIQYIVKTPIYGYSGMGYSHLSHITKSFNTEKAARKWKKHCDFAHKIHLAHYHFGNEERFDNYIRHMTDEISYHIDGISKIYKRTIEEEELI